MESFLVGRIGDKKIAINVNQIHFVIRNNGIVEVPDMPEWMSGIISFRDKIVPVINNEVKLKIKNDKTERKRIVLCQTNSTLIGLNLDEFLEIKKVNERDGRGVALKLENEIIPIVNPDNLLTEEEIEFAEKL